MHGHSISQQQIDAILASDGSLVWNAQTNSFYEYVSVQALWEAAQDAAQAKIVGGIEGHLAVITSQTEQTLLAALSSNPMWIGNKNTSSDLWQWYGGPEDGLQFWSGDDTGSAVNNLYSNWAAGQPNGSDGYLVISNAGTWNDIPEQNRDYIIEWGCRVDV